MNRRGMLALSGAAMARAADAQPSAPANWPDRPIRMVVPFPAGGATDIWSRMCAEGIGPALGQPVVIENRAGASGMLGAELVAKAAPDGHTLLFTISPLVQAPVVLRRWPYDPIRDFAPIGRLGTTPLPYVIRPDIPAQTLAEFIAWAKGRDLSFGSYGTGSSGHAMGQLLSDTAGLGMTHVGYRGEAPMLADVLGGRVVGGFHSMTVAGDYIRSGRLRPLASLGRQRVPSLPTVPTFLELGFPEAFAMAGFIGLLAPAAVPAPVLARLAAVFEGWMARPDTQRRLLALDTLPGWQGPAEFAAEMANGLRQWTELVERMGLSADG